MRRKPKPKPPSFQEIQDKLDELIPLMEQHKAFIGKWPAYRIVSDPLDGLRRYEKDIMKEPSHPRHQQWLDEQERRSNPENWHRR